MSRPWMGESRQAGGSAVASTAGVWHIQVFPHQSPGEIILKFGMRRVEGFAVAAALVIGGCGRALAVEPRLDGLYPDWSPANLIATDPAGDASGAFDVRNVYATNRGTRLFLRFDIGSVVNLQSGDAGDGTLRVQINMPNSRALTIDTRNKTLWRDNNTGLTVSWLLVGYSSAPTYADDEFELSVDLSTFGVAVGSPITINFSSSDTLAANANFTMSEPTVTPQRRSASRAPGTEFRVASVNTEQTGLLDATRRPMLLRLCDAMNADIYCFQEEYNSSAAQVDQHLTSVDPMEDGANWNVFKNNDCVIASRSPLLALPSPNTATAGAVVDLPAAGTADAVVVFSIHPKCCGYTGNADDAQRISQMSGLIDTLNNLRSGALGAAFDPYRNAPALIIGDWNLVGSRTPLDMVLDPAPGAPNMTDALPPNLIGEDVMTWRGTSTTPGSFTPGRLDLLTYTDATLDVLGSFVLDSQLLNAGELAALGLQASDSTASDHNMLVGDVAFASAPPPPCFGDANADGVITFTDVTVVLANFGASNPSGTGPGDADHNGVVNFADVTAVLSAFGGACP